MDKLIKKNILDLQFQKNLTIASTSIIVAFTYLIAVAVAFVTKQLTFDFFPMIKLVVFSIVILAPCFLIFFKASIYLKSIPEAIRNL